VAAGDGRATDARADLGQALEIFRRIGAAEVSSVEAELKSLR
jgi:hypothetical protein